jgi:protein-disulfide isomerase
MPDKAVSKRRERRAQIRRQEQSGRLVTIGLITLGALFIVVAFIYPQFKPILNLVTVTPMARPNVDRNNMGDPNAPIQITVYSDFQCPFCKQFFNQTESLLTQYYISTGKAHFTYRSAGNWVSNNIAASSATPSATPKTESQDAALAAYCAADQNKFWEMHDALFANNRDVEDQGSFTDRRLTAIARTVTGLDVKTWQDCYDSSKYKNQVKQDLEDAMTAKIDGTPYFVITYTVKGETKTKLIHGNQSFNTFQVELEAALSEINSQ